ncbi:MAG: class I SAM-dependent methyltransferase [Alphaproteobacteria bacterium]|nr:class I SAM-dependent methyltransferase [Alphaproteobacteria bacterium]
MAADNPVLERWNKRYGGEDYVFGTTPNAFLASQAKLLRPGERALSIADGEGRNGVWLAEQGLDVLSIDHSQVGLAKAEKLAAERGVRLETRQTDIAAWDWDGESFDIIAGIFIQFAAPPLRARIFAGVERALRPGGRLILQGYRPEQLQYGTGGSKSIENKYTTELLTAAFVNLEIRHLREHDSVIHEGTGHDGMSALIDLVAVKP